MYLRSRTPFSDELAQRLVVIERCRCEDDSGELIQEQASVGGWEELDPGEGVSESVSYGHWTVNGEVAKRATDRRESVCSLRFTVGSTQPEIGLVPPSEKDVTLIEVIRVLLRLAEQVRERALDQPQA